MDTEHCIGLRAAVHVYRYSEERTVYDEGVEWSFELVRVVVYMMMLNT